MELVFTVNDRCKFGMSIVYLVINTNVLNVLSLPGDRAGSVFIKLANCHLKVKS